MGHAAEDVGSGGDDTGPNGTFSFEAVEGTGVVVKTLGEEGELIRVMGRVAVAVSVELGAEREVGGMAGDAEGGFLMGRGDAVVDAAATGGVGVPGVAGGDEVVDGGLHGFARICIGREVVEAGEELIGGVGHANADEVGTGLAEGAGRELVAREGLDFMGEGDRVFAFRVLGEFTVDEVVKRDIDGDVVAVVEIESEMEKLRGGRGKLEAEPVFGGGLFSGITERDIRSFVAGGDH